MEVGTNADLVETNLGFLAIGRSFADENKKKSSSAIEKNNLGMS